MLALQDEHWLGAQDAGLALPLGHRLLGLKTQAQYATCKFRIEM